jgi:hypothetical protein
LSLKGTRTLVEEMRTFINSADHTNNPRTADLASQYADAAREANARLQRASELLQNGHRTAAIQYADAAPELLSLVTTLNFPELSQWQEVAASYGWERAPAIKTEIAATLSDAYALERELQPLLKRHRWLALRNAPIAERLAALREIAAADHTSPIWLDDIAVFEQERARELTLLGQAATRAHDFAQLERFVAEYKQEKWTNPPPEPLQALNRQAVSVFHVQRTLPQLAGEMANHLWRQDGPRVLELLKSWNEVCDDVRQARPGWEPPPELMATVQPAVQLAHKVAEQQRFAAFQADLQELTIAIDTDARPEEVALLTAKVESHGFGLPAATRKALAEHRHAEATASALNTAMIVSVVLALLVLMIVGFFIAQSVMKPGQ